jgi:penicillin amidase
MPSRSRIFLAIALGLALLAGTAACVVRRNLPDASAPALPGLAQTAGADFDGRGVATIHAGSWTDLVRVQGYLVARERLFQMDLLRRRADGRLAEWAGRGVLGMDRIHRIYGFRAVAEQAAALLPAAERQDLEAYADGVNAFIQSHPGRWGLEFQLLGTRPEPWTAADSLKILLLLNEDMSTTWPLEIQERALEALPAATRGFLQPRFAPDDRPLVADGAPPVLETETFFRSPRPMPAVQARRQLEPDPPDPRLWTRQASNNWVIAGSRTRSGAPILANDPHLDLYCPGIWLTFRLEWDGRWAQGVACPGLPGLVIGHNERIAWGITNLGTDVQDLYRESATGQRSESIRIRGGQSETLQVALGAHGPQVRPGLSLAWTILEPRLIRLPVRALNGATDWESFNRAVDAWAGPAMNMVYADTLGHIGWRASGLIPLRVPGDDGSRIHEDGRGGWLGFLPAQAMPRLLDPPEGFIATANNRTIGTGFPHPVATAWADTSRLTRIRSRLQAAADWTPATVDALQRDDFSSFHQAFRTALEPILGDLASFTQVELLRRVLRRHLLVNLLAGSGLAPEDYHWMADDVWILAAAQASREQWRVAGLGDKVGLLRDCLAEARQSRDWDRPWAEVNRLHIAHPLGVGGGILGWIFNPPAMRVPGSAGAIRVLAGIHGQSMRMVVDLADPEATRLVLPLGESGHLGSAQRTDQSRAWVAGDPDGQRTRLHQPACAHLQFQSLRP